MQQQQQQQTTSAWWVPKLYELKEYYGKIGQKAIQKKIIAISNPIIFKY